MQYYEQQSLPPREPLKDPELRNGLIARRLQPRTELQGAQIILWNEIEGNPTDNDNLLAALQNLEPSLGYTPLRPSNNLSELTDLNAAMVNLGLSPGGINDTFLRKEGGIMQGLLVLNLAQALLFQSNTNLPTAAKGMLDFDGKHLLFAQGLTRRPLSLLSDPLTSSEDVNNTTTETEIYAAILGANTLDAGTLVKALVCGRYSNTNGTSTFTLRFKVNGITLLSIISTAAAVTNQPFYAELLATIRSIGATGSIFPFIRGSINNVSKDTPGTATSTVDTTSDVTLSVTIQWSATDVGNTFSIDQALLHTN